MKCMLLVALFILITHVSYVEAFKYDKPINDALKMTAVIACLVPLEMEILDCIFTPSSNGCKFITNHKIWLASSCVGALFGILLYHYLKQYTPESRYSWALEIKETIKDNLTITKEDREIDPIFILYGNTSSYPEVYTILESSLGLTDAALAKLRYYYNRLNEAHQEVVVAVRDADPEDIAFKQDCQQLSNDIKALIQTVESFIRKILSTSAVVAEASETVFSVTDYITDVVEADLE